MHKQFMGSQLQYQYSMSRGGGRLYILGFVALHGIMTANWTQTRGFRITDGVETPDNELPLRISICIVHFDLQGFKSEKNGRSTEQ